MAAVAGGIVACGPARPRGPGAVGGGAGPSTGPGASGQVSVSQGQSGAEQLPMPTKFKEAPQLAELVRQGKLPPVEQRLPQNPRVIKPLQQVGQYGGTWRRAYRGLSDRWGPTKLLEEQAIEWDAPDPNTIRLTANVVEKWEQSADGSEFTFYLRKGLKWSDGTEVTTEDVRFWYEDVQLYKEIVPNPTAVLRQRVGNETQVAQLNIVDKYTFKLRYPLPNPLLPIQVAKSGTGVPGMGAFILPAAYLKKFHPKYANVEELRRLAADKKLASWDALWGTAGDMQGPIAFWFLNPDLPVITPWKITKPTPADPVVMERNPYYWQVDIEGNQLPYIDTIEHSFFDNDEVLKLWVAGGRIDMQMRHMSTGAYTFYKENESRGGYKVFKWRAASTDAYFPNINCPDQVLAQLFDTPEFRQALSIAINRQEINDLVWNGLGKPRQASPVPGSPEYDPELEKVWTEYNPQKANELLDKLGLTRNPDGTRRRPDGKVLEVTIEHTSAPGSPENDAHELVKKYWNAIGVRTTVRYVERTLYEQHVHNGEIEIGFWGFDRCSVVKADPGRWLGTIDDGPWAPTYGHWYANSPYKREEPPPNHPIRQIWQLWDRVQVEPDEARRNALFQEILNIHKRHPWAIGVVGEKVAPMIVSNNFKNVGEGYIADDTLRDYGLINPQQFFIIKR